MKRLFATVALATALGCATYGPVMLETQGPLRRQAERVVERHDKYVQTDLTITGAQRSSYLEQSSKAREIVMIDQVSAESLAYVLAPVLDRHDAYVYEDATLDELEKGVFLGSSEALRSLLSKARAMGIPQH